VAHGLPRIYTELRLCWTVVCENNNRAGPVKVMIVDDHAEMRTLLRSLLSGVAQEFVECACGEEAVSKFATERPDWTVMDVCMPGVNGLVATRQIKAQFPEARILIITQHDNLKLRESARQAGATDFLGKEELTHMEEIIHGPV
jgi:CheY-like chemotaxis protein